MAQAPYGIKEFDHGNTAWRVVLFGGATLNPSVPSEPVIEVLLASVPDGCRDPLAPEAMQGTVARQVRIGVGQLPYVTIGSIWQSGYPVNMSSQSTRRLQMQADVTRSQFVSLSDLSRVIPRYRYPFDKNWRYALDTQFVAIEDNGDPYAILVPVIELIRFYYAPSTRLSQALFWGCYANSINKEKCGQLVGGPYRVHLRYWIHDSDAWTLARYHASDHMQKQVRRLYQGLQKFRANAPAANPEPFRKMQCGFPFVGKSNLEAVCLSFPGAMEGHQRRLVLKLLRCSAPFPFDELLCDRDNQNLKGKESGDELLPANWRIKICEEDKDLDENGNPRPGAFHSDSEPQKGAKPLIVDIRENRFSYLDGKKLIKEPPERQKYRHVPMVVKEKKYLKGFSTGWGIWSGAQHRPAEVNSSRAGNADKPMLPISFETFLAAMKVLAETPDISVRYVSGFNTPITSTESPVALAFPWEDTSKPGKLITWATVNSENGMRHRQVIVAEVQTKAGICYVLEAERTGSRGKLSILFIVADEASGISGEELYSLLWDCAKKGGWLREDEIPEYRRATCSHANLSEVAVLTERIRHKVYEVTGVVDAARSAKSADPTESESSESKMESSEQHELA